MHADPTPDTPDPYDHSKHRCQYCGREARSCFIMPCLYVENFIIPNKRKVAGWLRNAGYRATITKSGDVMVRPPKVVAS